MRVLALLSGGKDSVCAVETARGHGWDVVAALAMRPVADDAWMFHTPNLDVVRGVAQCLGLPLLEFPARDGKEEELADLRAALRAAKLAFRLDGFVSGALASEYQRTRLDRLGHELGLRSFAPLWHKSPGPYMAAIARHWDVRFSRVAAQGIPTSWAGARLDPAKVEILSRPELRIHPAGEGGEYETLVLDAPGYSRRLVVDESHGHEGPTRATWAVTEWHTEPKTVAAEGRYI